MQHETGEVLTGFAAVDVTLGVGATEGGAAAHGVQNAVEVASLEN